MTARLSDVGQFVQVTTSALRPAAATELAAYGISRTLRGARAIDIGAGDGRLAFGAAAAGAREVVAVDPDPDALRAGRARARELGVTNVSFRIGAAQDLPVAAGRFDLAILSWTL